MQNKKTQVLTEEQREKINEILNETEILTRTKTKTEEWFIPFQEEKISKIFDNVKVTEENQEEVEYLREKAFKTLNNRVAGVGDWEDLEILHLRREAKCHFDALTGPCKEWNDRQKNALKEEINNHLKKNELSNKKIQIQKAQITNLEKGLDKKEKSLEIANQAILKEKSQKKEIKSQLELTTQLYLDTKPLPSLPKEKSKFQKLRTKLKTKFQKLVKKEKCQKQEMIAQIEVKVN